jgi:hypothetical protein
MSSKITTRLQGCTAERAEADAGGGMTLWDSRTKRGLERLKTPCRGIGFTIAYWM